MLAAQFSAEPALIDSWQRVLAAFKSDYDARNVLEALLVRPELSDAALGFVLRATTSLHYD